MSSPLPLTLSLCRPTEIVIPDGINESQVPADFWCPKSREIMRQPAIVTTSAITYDRAEIVGFYHYKGMRWLRLVGSLKT